VVAVPLHIFVSPQPLGGLVCPIKLTRKNRWQAGTGVATLRITGARMSH
jgi:hypothetical protein